MSRTVKAWYDCFGCYRVVAGGDAKWSLPKDRAVMTMDDDRLRDQMVGPDCPHCGTRLQERVSDKQSSNPKGMSDG